MATAEPSSTFDWTVTMANIARDAAPKQNRHDRKAIRTTANQIVGAFRDGGGPITADTLNAYFAGVRTGAALTGPLAEKVLVASIAEVARRLMDGELV